MRHFKYPNGSSDNKLQSKLNLFSVAFLFHYLWNNINVKFWNGDRILT